jgi:hypothetical protein
MSVGEGRCRGRRDQEPRHGPAGWKEEKKCGTAARVSLAAVDPGGYWCPPTYSTWTPTIASFSFSVSTQFTIFSSFSGPELPEPF